MGKDMGTKDWITLGIVGFGAWWLYTNWGKFKWPEFKLPEINLFGGGGTRVSDSPADESASEMKTRMESATQRTTEARNLKLSGVYNEGVVQGIDNQGNVVTIKSGLDNQAKIQQFQFEINNNNTTLARWNNELKQMESARDDLRVYTVTEETPFRAGAPLMLSGALLNLFGQPNPSTAVSKLDVGIAELKNRINLLNDENRVMSGYIQKLGGTEQQVAQVQVPIATYGGRVETPTKVGMTVKQVVENASPEQLQEYMKQGGAYGYWAKQQLGV